MKTKRVVVEVPDGYERIVEAVAAAAMEKEALNGPLKREDHQEIGVLQAVRAELSEHAHHPNPARSLASKYGSRTGRIFVAFEGYELPVKALYCAVMTRRGQVYWDSPSEFHSSEAVEFFASNGLDIVRR